ncbi:MAG TPA: TolC family protein, partial [Candidatus Nitrosotalea sp.]|nr:TolC family protein [Candidatus Nitrosotalea sp.]
TDGLVAPVVVVDKMESWQNAEALRPDLLEFRLVLEKQDLVIRYQFNQLFPSLNLVGGYGLNGVQGSFDGVLDQITSRANPAYSYGVVVSIPLGGNRTARNNYKAAQAAKQQSLLQYKKLEQEVLTQVDVAADTVQTEFKRVRSTRQARVYAEAALDAEVKKLQNGLSTSFVVLQLQQNLTDARSAEIRALADYNEALAQLAFAEGTTLEKNHVNVTAN